MKTLTGKVIGRGVFGFAGLLLLTSCLGVPEGIKPIENFELADYLGTWHEIARLDHRFERGLSGVTANYQRRLDGGVAVVNRGYNSETGQWRQAQGRAYFVNQSDVGHLKVSFFGPFYGSYVIFEKDPASQVYAFVSGPDRSYLWFLAREPQVSGQLKQHFLEISRALGFAVDELVWVEQEPLAESAAPTSHP
ncbi:MAG: lipocalin family protein [Pseudomonadales bacterium]